MGTELLHFRGKFKGIFRTEQSGSTHAGVFYDFVPRALEISEIESLPQRDALLEKTGDYYFASSLEPAGKWGLGGIDLSLIKDEHTAFSEKIINVVLCLPAQSRKHFSPFRTFSHTAFKDQEYLLEGTAYFSVPAKEVSYVGNPTENSRSQSENSIPVFPNDASITDVPIAQIVSGIDVAPEPVVVQTIRKGCLPIPLGNNMGRGCLGPIFSLLRYLFVLFLVINIFGWVSSWLSHQVKENEAIETRRGEAEAKKPRLDPKQDTMSKQAWNYFVDHAIKWADFSKREYLSEYTTSTLEFAASGKKHMAWAKVPMTNQMLFFHDLYKDFHAFDTQKLDSLHRYFAEERRLKNLNALATAEMVVTFIQEIPYVLVHDMSCARAAAMGGFMAEYHADGKPCLPNIFAGVMSPYEFAHTLKGDCDTRSLLAYTLLSKLGIPCSIWVSRQYGHSVLGVGVGGNSGNYKQVSGTRHFATELTAKGFRVGMIAPQHNNMNNWNVVLNNQ